jgi:thiol:disulfide interchange protein DsbD
VAEFAVRTAISVMDTPAWVAKVDGIQWPEPHPGKLMNPEGEGTIEAPLYSGTAVAFVRVEVAETAAPGRQELALQVVFQACNDRTCDMKATVDVPVTIEVASLTNSASGMLNEPDLFATYDAAAWGNAAPAKAKPIEFNVFGVISFKLAPDGIVGMAALLGLAVVGGVLLNFTPCVLPVIPIKIISLSNAAGNPRRCLVLGVVMSAGVVAFWLAIGGAMAFVASFKSASALFQNPWVPLAFGVFMLAMGLGMFNLFTLKLPRAVYLVNPKNETLAGAFLFGIMTAILSTPCTAPFGGAAMAWAAFQAPATTMGTFAAIGAGMALPYMILSANPKWVKKMPRTGPASELIKQLMGMLMFAVAAFFVGQAV